MKFNALIAVDSDKTLLSANLAIELERIVKPWMEGRFDWYAIGTGWWEFSAYLDPEHGWVDDDDNPAFQIEFARWVANPPSDYVLVPIRCHC